MKKVAGIVVEELTPEQTHERRNEIFSNQEIIQGLEAFNKLLGTKTAADLFSLFLENLKYAAIEHPIPENFTCPCIQRKKINPSYICTGSICQRLTRRNTHFLDL